MKQAIVLSGPEISALKRGKSLEISLQDGSPLLILGEKDTIYLKKVKSLQKARSLRYQNKVKRRYTRRKKVVANGGAE